MSFKKSVLAAAVAVGLMSVASAAMAQNVVTGGATLPQDLYTVILPAGASSTTFSYTGTGSGTGKTAVLNNTGASFGKAGRSVPMAASDVIITATEDSDYATAHILGSSTSADNWGPVVQFPSVATSVTLPFNKNNTAGNPQSLNFRGTATSINPDVFDLCGVFSGRITDWSGIANSGRTGAITVLYRSGGSGTSAMLGNYLNAVCSGDVAGNPNLKGGNFTVDQQDFSKQFVGDAVPANFVAVSGSAGMRDAVFATEGAIGYVGPEVIAAADLADSTIFAQISGYSPTAANISSAISESDPPEGGNVRSAWLPNFGNATGGYPILGFTSWIVAQCYKGTDTNNTYTTMKTYLDNHFNGNYDTQITAHNFVPLPQNWKDAVKSNFLAVGSTNGLKNSTTCNAIGRPLL